VGPGGLGLALARGGPLRARRGAGVLYPLLLAGSMTRFHGHRDQGTLHRDEVAGGRARAHQDGLLKDPPGYFVAVVCSPVHELCSFPTLGTMRQRVGAATKRRGQLPMPCRLRHVAAPRISAWAAS
jgi:hypothetical protein